MKKNNELRKLILGSMPKSKEHRPLAIGFALAFCMMFVCCCAGSWLALPFGAVALYLSKRMDKKGMEVEE